MGQTFVGEEERFLYFPGFGMVPEQEKGFCVDSTLEESMLFPILSPVKADFFRYSYL